MNKEREEEVLEMADAGLRPAAIAEEMDVSVTVIRKILKKYGKSSGGPRAIDGEDEAVEDYVKGEPIPTILGKYSLTYSQLYSILTRHEVPIRKVSNANVRQQRLNLAIEMYKAGEPLWRIKNETGIAQPTLHAELHSRQIPLRRAQGLGNFVDSSEARDDES